MPKLTVGYVVDNLEVRSEMCSLKNTGRKNYAKIAMRTVAQGCRAMSSQL